MKLPAEKPEGTRFDTITWKVILLDILFLGALYLAFRTQTDISIAVGLAYMAMMVVSVILYFASNIAFANVPLWHLQGMVERYQNPRINAYNWVTEIGYLFLLYLNEYWLCIVGWIAVNAIYSAYRAKLPSIVEQLSANNTNSPGP